jgi:hypothetical protein
MAHKGGGKWPPEDDDAQERELKKALHEEAERIEPRPGMAEIRGKIARHAKPKREPRWRKKGKK